MNYETTLDSSDLLIADPDGGHSRRKLYIALAVILALAIAAAAYFFAAGKDGDGKAADDKASQAQTVTVIAPGSSTVSRTISATGTLAARREIPIGVVGEGGRVTAVYADAGDWVQQGQTLVAIDRSVQAQQAEALRSQIGVSEADLRLAQNELDRAAQLVERGFISKADIDRKTAARDSARARLNVARAQYQQSLASNARLTVRAPSSGYILERNVEVGQTATAGSGPLFRMAKGGEMELRAQLSETDLAVVSVGTTATVTPVGTDRQFSGNIWQIAPVINEQSRQGIARISVPFDVALKPGGFATATITTGTMTATILPESAVQEDEKGRYVYIVGKDNKVVRRDIKIGAVTNNGVPILSGLNGNERIVLYAAGFLNPGEKIVPSLKKPEAKPTPSSAMGK